MDSVFVSSRKPPKKGLLKNLIGARSRKGNSDKSPASDAVTEYFPFAGGDGVDSYEFQPDHMSYEPAESMLDTDVSIEADYSARLRRNVKKVFLRNSNYEVFSRNPEVSEHTELTAPINEPESFPELEPHLQNTNIPSSHSGDGIEGFWTLQWLNNLPPSFDTAIPYIRRAARATVILIPLDAVPDLVEGTEILVAGIEVFLFMLAADFAARLVRIVCFPAVSLALFILHLL